MDVLIDIVEVVFEFFMNPTKIFSKKKREKNKENNLMNGEMSLKNRDIDKVKNDFD